jgi:hypothetical protein
MTALLTQREAATILRLSTRTLERLRVADTKQIPEHSVRQAPTKYEIGKNCGADDESRHAPPTNARARR